MATQGDDEDDINPVKMILPDEDQGKSLTMLSDGTAKQQLQQHYIRSIESMVVIRQLPSEGLSFQLWPAATTLVTLLDNHRCHPSKSPLTTILTALSKGGDNIRKLKILEIGSGTGLAGIAAAVTLGAKVTVTDLPHVIPNLQFNVDANADLVAQNGGTVNVAPLRWGEDEDVEAIGREFDLVLASDVVYHDHLFQPLIETLRFLLNGGGEKKVFVMAHLRRWKKDSAFFKKAKKFFDVETLHTDPPQEGTRIGVVVYGFFGKNLKC
ncbi:protein N-lysine methyltransferase METTL21A-like [Durio zibethinus]|uniref:Protein N-lysine methyltransferase METTL21A-like n=1 Tax=Durio zibethinus TaxID=66656 RepID=A0A6P5YM28_DURZI|nr:protein N-lysine methyltransferase METTL21A-like [Durio zibethinus]